MKIRQLAAKETGCDRMEKPHLEGYGFEDKEMMIEWIRQFKY